MISDSFSGHSIHSIDFYSIWGELGYNEPTPFFPFPKLCLCSHVRESRTKADESPPIAHSVRYERTTAQCVPKSLLENKQRFMQNPVLHHAISLRGN